MDAFFIIVLAAIVAGVLLGAKSQPPADPIAIYIDRTPQQVDSSLGCGPVLLVVLLMFVLFALLGSPT